MNKVVEEAEEVNNKITHYARNDDVDGLLYTLNTANKTLEALTIALKRDDTFTHAKRVLQVLKRNTTDAMTYCTTHLHEQAQNNIVVLDIETTEIVQYRAHIKDMTVSVACANVLYKNTLHDPKAALEAASTYIFWNSDVDGAPVSMLMELLRSASLIVAYNGKNFDLIVLSKYMCNKTELRQLQERCLDSFAILRKSLGWIKLDDLLIRNNIAPKLGSGTDAPALWRDRQLEQLAAYCARDVEALSALVLMPRIRVSDTVSTEEVSLCTALGLADDDLASSSTSAELDTRVLRQGSPEYGSLLGKISSQHPSHRRYWSYRRSSVAMMPSSDCLV